MNFGPHISNVNAFHNVTNTMSISMLDCQLTIHQFGPDASFASQRQCPLGINKSPPC
jgi:hypothetical protein